MQETTIKGFLTENQCEKIFISKGIIISKPVVNDCRYDYIIDINNHFYRIQCKTGTLSEDGSYIHFGTKTKNIRNGMNNYYDETEIDYFYTCYNNIHYLVPVQKAGKGDTRLRLFSNCSSNNPNIRWAKDYELDLILNGLQEQKEEVV